MSLRICNQAGSSNSDTMTLDGHDGTRVAVWVSVPLCRKHGVRQGEGLPDPGRARLRSWWRDEEVTRRRHAQHGLAPERRRCSTTRPVPPVRSSTPPATEPRRPTQVDRLRLELEQRYSNAARAGRPLSRGESLDWKCDVAPPRPHHSPLLTAHAPSPAPELKFTALDLKRVEPDGTFAGYASLFDTEDMGRDIVAARRLPRQPRQARRPPASRCCSSTTRAEPIGVWEHLRRMPAASTPGAG